MYDEIEDSVANIVVEVPVVAPDVACDHVLDYFNNDQDLLIISVLKDGRLVGLVYRVDFMQNLATRFGFAVYSKRPIGDLMNDAPLIVDSSDSLDSLINTLVTNDVQALLTGFAICRGEEYLGAGTVLSLLQAQNHRAQKKSQKMLKAKNIAEEANRSKSIFLANMNHELRTPLNAIIGFTEIMQKGIYGPIVQDQYIEYIDIVNNSGNHLLNTINAILEMSKIEAGMLELKEDDADILEIIECAKRMVQPMADKKEIDVTCQGRPDIPLIMGDQGILRQVMLNLLSNAIKFSKPKTKVKIAAYLSEAGMVVIEVIDQGIGIAQQDMEKILLPFYQVDGSHSRAEEGTGLGLSIVKDYLDLHEAEFEIKSQLGVGTEISILFPQHRLKMAEAESKIANAH